MWRCVEERLADVGREPREHVGVDADEVDRVRRQSARRRRSANCVVVAPAWRLQADRQHRDARAVERRDHLPGDLADAHLGRQVADDVDPELGRGPFSCRSAAGPGSGADRCRSAAAARPAIGTSSRPDWAPTPMKPGAVAVQIAGSARCRSSPLLVERLEVARDADVRSPRGRRRVELGEQRRLALGSVNGEPVKPSSTTLAIEPPHQAVEPDAGCGRRERVRELSTPLDALSTQFAPRIRRRAGAGSGSSATSIRS